MERLMNLQALVGRWKGAFKCSINKLNPEREGRVRGEKPDERLTAKVCCYATG